MRTTRTRSFSSSTLWCFEFVCKGSHLCSGRCIGEGMARLSSSHKSAPAPLEKKVSVASSSKEDGHFTALPELRFNWDQSCPLPFVRLVPFCPPLYEFPSLRRGQSSWQLSSWPFRCPLRPVWSRARRPSCPALANLAQLRMKVPPGPRGRA